MKRVFYAKSKLHFIGLLLIGMILLMSNNNNPPNGHTGAPGDSNCTSCHNSGNPNGFDGNITIDGLPATAVPGQTYPLTITVSNPNGLANKAGFQLVVLNASNQNFGILTTSDNNGAVQSSGGRTYFEHDPAQNFPGSNMVTWSFNWQAPNVGTAQNFTIYAAANIANGNNNNTGDYIINRTFAGSVVPQPDPLTVTVSGSNVGCFGGTTGSATAQPAGGTPPYSYSWSNGGMTQTISNLPAGTYSVTVSDNNSQTASGSVQITEPNQLLVDIQASVPEITCNVTSSNLTTAVSGGGAPYSYSWSTGETSSSITVIAGGVYSVTVTNSNNCTASATITITENLDLTATMSPISPACENDQPVLLSGFPAGGSFSGNGVVGNTFNPAIAGAGNHTITYTYSEGQCTATATQVAIVIPLPTIQIQSPGELCLDDPTVTLTATPAGGVFSGPGITPNGILTPSQAGVGDHIITYSVGGQCPASGTIIVSILDCACPNPVVVDAGMDATICAENSVQLNGSGMNTTAFVWTTSGDGMFHEPTSLSTLYTPGPQDIENGSVVLKLTGEDPDAEGPCSSASDQVTITILPIPIIELNVPGTVCVHIGSIELEASPEGGVWTGPNVVNNIFSFDTAGVYTLVYEVTAQNGCSNSAAAIIQVNECNNFFTGHAEITHVNCQYDATGSITIIPGDDAVLPITYEWSNGATTASIENLSPGNYTVTAFDAEGKILVLTATVLSESTLSINHPDMVSCFTNQLACPDIVGSAGSVTLLWSNGSQSECQDLIPNEQLCVTAEDQLGCIAEKCILFIPLTVIIDAVQQPSDGNPGSIQVSVSGGAEPYSYKWFKDGQEIGTTKNLNGIVSNGIYHLEVTDANGCIAFTDDVAITGLSTNVVDGNPAKIYPNPFSSHLTLEINNPASVKQIYAISPVNQTILVNWQQNGTNQLTINLDNQPSGVIYLVVLEEGKVVRYKVMKL